MENVNDEEDINRIWENIKENIQTSAEESLVVHDLKQNRPWLDEECLGSLDQRSGLKCSGYRIQAKAIYYVDILNNVRLEVSRNFRNKRRHI